MKIIRWVGVIEMNEKILTKGGLTYKYESNDESGYKEVLLSYNNEY